MKVTTLFLKSAVLLIGLVVLGLSVFGLPKLAAFSTTANPEFAYLKWPVMLGLFMTEIPFFLALYQSFKLLRLIENKDAFSEEAVKSLSQIKINALVITLLYVSGALFLSSQKALHPGVALIGIVIIFTSVTIFVFAAVLQGLLGHALEFKSENDLIV
ncbi:DUF2975 domain-containing protein [Rossellomorea oryzaecorticis]|uniref:DUF2975 domain-containing protein n=1 Tax=Rossellomorea oryzaecorticis TaxID=1396505 RepID=A0ABU9K5S2_9BACI